MHRTCYIEQYRKHSITELLWIQNTSISWSIIKIFCMKQLFKNVCVCIRKNGMNILEYRTLLMYLLTHYTTFLSDNMIMLKRQNINSKKKLRLANIFTHSVLIDNWSYLVANVLYQNLPIFGAEKSFTI